MAASGRRTLACNPTIQFCQRSRTGVLMPRLKIGDRVELVGDIARFYKCTVGVIAKVGADTGAILNQYTVLLADGTITSFFDFQLQTLPAVVAHVVFDSAISAKSAGIRGESAVRQIRLLARDVHIHLRVSGSGTKTIVGQVAGATTRLRQGLVFLLDGDEILYAAEGDTLKRRYKVIRIMPTSVLMEDTESKHQQPLPLVEESQS